MTFPNPHGRVEEHSVMMLFVTHADAKQTSKYHNAKTMIANVRDSGKLFTVCMDTVLPSTGQQTF